VLEIDWIKSSFQVASSAAADASADFEKEMTWLFLFDYCNCVVGVVALHLYRY